MGENIKKYLSNNWVFIIFILLFYAWQIPGVIPFISYEADAVSISADCENAYNTSWKNLGDNGYGFWMQPLTYYLISILKHLCRFYSAEQIYSILTVACAFIVQLLSVLFAAKIVKLNYITVLISLFLIPESYMISMYPNSTVIAMMPMLGGLYCILLKRRILAFLLLTISPLFRLDILMVYPVILLLMRISGYDWMKSGYITIGYGALLIIILWLVYPFLGGDISYTISEFSRWQNLVSLKRHMLAILGFYGIIVPLLLFPGLVILYRKKDYIVIALVVSVVIIVHMVNYRFGNASKHYALLFPFILIPVAVVIEKIKKTSTKRLSYFIGCLIFLIQAVGIRLSPEKYELRSIQNKYVPTVCYVYKNEYFSIVFGGGQTANTCDELIMLSGNLFYPFYIHNIKEETLHRIQSIADALSKVRNNELIIIGWEQEQRMKLLQSLGLKCPQAIFIETNEIKNLDKIDQPDMVMEAKKDVVQYVDSKIDTKSGLFLVVTEASLYRFDYFFDHLCKFGEAEKINSSVYKLNVKFPRCKYD